MRGRLDGLLALARRYPWIVGAIGLLLVSFVVVLWAGVRPGYDPYGWLTWGKLTLHGMLDTNGAPSWKPRSRSRWPVRYSPGGSRSG